MMYGYIRIDTHILTCMYLHNSSLYTPTHTYQPAWSLVKTWVYAVTYPPSFSQEPFPLKKSINHFIGRHLPAVLGVRTYMKASAHVGC